MNGQVYITVIDESVSTAFFQGYVNVGEDFQLVEPNNDKFPARIIVIITKHAFLEVESYIHIGDDNVLQVIEIDTSCSGNLFLGDIFGSIQLIELANKDQGLLSSYQTVTLNIELPPTSSSTSTLTLPPSNNNDIGDNNVATDTMTTTKMTTTEIVFRDISTTLLRYGNNINNNNNNDFYIDHHHDDGPTNTILIEFSVDLTTQQTYSIYIKVVVDEITTTTTTTTAPSTTFNDSDTTYEEDEIVVVRRLEGKERYHLQLDILLFQNTN